jgi:Fe-S protein assembly co-chaperone HscB
MPVSLEVLRESRNHFTSLGLPRSYVIDKSQLEKNYLELARLTHPDLAGDDAEAQLAALDLSAKLNEAHRILADDEARASYYLTLIGGPSPEEHKSLPEGFLPLIMIAREELAEAQLEGDTDRIKSLEQDAIAQKQARLSEFERLITNATPENLQLARTELNAVRYYERLLESTRGEAREM